MLVVLLNLFLDVKNYNKWGQEMKGMRLCEFLMNKGEAVVDRKKEEYNKNQWRFVDEITPVFKGVLNRMPVEPRRILVLFGENPQMRFKEIVSLSRRPGNKVAVYLGRLRDRGFLIKREDGLWEIVNNDLLAYMIARFHHKSLVQWLEHNEANLSDFIYSYIEHLKQVRDE